MRKWVVLIVSMLVFTQVSAQEEGKTFVLVHGAFQDASGWDAVIPVLEAAGHRAIAVQQAGRGDDETPLNEITLATYRDTIVEVIEAQESPVVLVGHSFGGIVISSVAEAVPDQIEQVVYLAAYLPQSGDSLVTLSSNDHYSVLGQEGNFGLSEDFTTAFVNEEVFASAFCPDCDEAQLEMVAASQLSEPLAPLNEAVELTEENFGNVRKVYILTAEDVVVSPQLQAYMLSRTSVDRVYALNTGHTPYVSAPEALGEVLITAITEE